MNGQSKGLKKIEDQLYDIDDPETRDLEFLNKLIQ